MNRFINERNINLQLLFGEKIEKWKEFKVLRLET